MLDHNEPNRLIIVRHGATTWNTENRLNSRTDVPLCEMGKKKVKELAGNLKNVTLTRIFSSPQPRAYQTAKLLAQHQKCGIELDERLKELDFGPFEGTTPTEIAQGPLAEAFEQWRNEASPEFPEGAEHCLTSAPLGQIEVIA